MKLNVGYRGIEYVMGDIFFKTSVDYFGDFLFDGIRMGRELEQLGDKNRHKLEFIWVVSKYGSHFFLVKTNNVKTVSQVNGDFYHVKPYAPKYPTQYRNLSEYQKDCFVDSITKEEAVVLCEKGGAE